jgi:hypothetical protein
VSERSCARCGAEIGHLRADAIYCGDYCRFKAWLDRNPAARRARAQRLATVTEAYSTRSARGTRSGAHGEHGTRIYFTAADLVELRDLVDEHASPRLIGKVAVASERVERD